jgi:prevent-host-death family protein
MAVWQVQDAKTRLSEVIERARTEGPHTITRHGAERAIVLSIEDYRALAAHKPDISETRRSHADSGIIAVVRQPESEAHVRQPTSAFPWQQGEPSV